jgi:uncharacterized protein YjgD (DUF1641 family)
LSSDGTVDINLRIFFQQILLDLLKDPEVEAALQPWKTNLTALGKTIVGQSAELLEANRFFYAATL